MAHALVGNFGIDYELVAVFPLDDTRPDSAPLTRLRTQQKTRRTVFQLDVYVGSFGCHCIVGHANNGVASDLIRIFRR